jgi:hypothetical protein
MANTFTLIAKTTITEGATSVVFSNISQAYTDLVVKTSIRDNNVSPWGNSWIQLNANTTDYDYEMVRGLGSDGISASYSAAPNQALYTSFSSAAQATAGIYGSSETYIPNYTVATPKAVFINTVSENNSTNNASISILRDYASASAIVTSLTFLPSASFVGGSTIYLYGILKS